MFLKLTIVAWFLVAVFFGMGVVTALTMDTKEKIRWQLYGECPRRLTAFCFLMTLSFIAGVALTIITILTW